MFSGTERIQGSVRAAHPARARGPRPDPGGAAGQVYRLPTTHKLEDRRTSQSRSHSKNAGAQYFSSGENGAFAWNFERGRVQHEVGRFARPEMIGDSETARSPLSLAGEAFGLFDVAADVAGDLRPRA